MTEEREPARRWVIVSVRLLRKLYGAKRVVELKNGRLRFSYPDRWPELVAACEKTKEEAANAD